ncbi:MAG: His/Gly/Thr/Pro-type tRNA ligase C-terminal domain-containing protein, partial [Dehalococcoidales bacterium]|nr:His/Gly/Thr/Pro-type tRNA ligase C-terminal domain-containing protein [Dehalococcoidales bacterium]
HVDDQGLLPHCRHRTTEHGPGCDGERGGTHSLRETGSLPVGDRQSSLGGGGRYDNLIEAIGGKPTPALGFATGIERIILNLKRQNIPVPPLPKPRVFIAYVGSDPDFIGEVIKLAAQLRQAGIGVIAAIGSKSLKAQLRQANNFGARHTVIIGEQEVKTGTVILRDMTSAQQETVPLSQLTELLKQFQGRD